MAADVSRKLASSFQLFQRLLLTTAKDYRISRPDPPLIIVEPKNGSTSRPFFKTLQMLNNPNGRLVLNPGTQVTLLNNPKASGKIATHNRSNDKLFPRPPARTDINQGAIGNCYQLASINAIVVHPNGPDMIMDAMLDQNNGRVVVRLYVNEAWRYYSVEKSVHRRLFGLAHHSRGAIWVNILEKALMMLLSNGDYDLEKGGHPNAAMKMLMGPSSMEFVGTDLLDATSTLNNLLTYCYQQGRETITLTKVKATALTKIFVSQPYLTSFMLWNDSITANKWSSLKPAERTLTALENHLNASNSRSGRLDPTSRSLVIAYAVGMGAVNILGRYTATQIESYSRIGRALATHMAVTAETVKLSTGAKGFGDHFKKGGVGEGRQAGIFANHAYTVVSIESRAPTYLGVVIRNPHGVSGRKYRVNEHGELGASVATKAGEFWVELTEFLTDFDVSIGAAVQAPAREAMMDELQRVLADRREA